MVRIDQSSLDMLNAGKDIQKPKKNKYNAVKETTDGKTFDSQKEAARYRELKFQQHCGLISDLKTQIPFMLLESFKHKGKTQRAIKYIADFQYKKDGEIITEDTKGHRTKEYKMKKKLLLNRYPNINFIET